MKKAMLIGGPILVLLLVAPLLVAAVMVTLTTAAADCVDRQQPGGPPHPAPTTPGTGTVRVAQANIKVSLSGSAFAADLDKTISLGPDMVSLNEVGRRSNGALKRRGYDAYRGPGAGAQRPGEAVMWATERWAKVDAGRVVMLAQGPQKWDVDRGATWVTLQSTRPGGLDRVSMISLHHMINPAKYGPDKPWRQQLYRQGLEKVQVLIAQLSAQGPVIVGGDFNSQYTANDPWGPRKVLGATGMKSTYDALGQETTHDGGGTIDYLFYQPSIATPTRQWTRNLNSDHHLIAADLTVGTTTATSASRIRRTADADRDGGVAGVRRRLMQITFAPGYPTMSTEQADNAITIGQIALNDLDLPPQQVGLALEVAIATVIQESKLANLSGGDRDSAGLFQQRPSTGWGNHEQVTNPRLASLAFFGRAGHTDNPGLLDIPGWSQMPLTQAAQTVQRSGAPAAYEPWEAAAQEITTVLTGGNIDPPLNTGNVTTGAECASVDSPAGVATNCPETDSPAEAALTPDALLVLRCVEAKFGPHTYAGVGDRDANPDSDHPAGRAVDVMISTYTTPGGRIEGTNIASWIREHAQELGVTYIIWDAKIWSVRRAGDGWRPYSHPSGATDPTSLHRDHVHISVSGRAGTGLGVGDVAHPVPKDLVGADAHNWRESGSYWSRWHTGTDFSVSCETPVLAAHTGTIEIDRTQSWAGRWLVKVTTGPESLTTWYAHLHSLTVSDGDQVRAGQQIGEVGGDSPLDGNMSGCHLHFEVHESNGPIYGVDNVDPSVWLEENVR